MSIINPIDDLSLKSMQEQLMMTLHLDHQQRCIFGEALHSLLPLGLQNLYERPDVPAPGT
jgi:hypothetical protein